MTDLSERTAVLESLSERNQRDISALFKLMREHMDQEEADRKEIIHEIQTIKDMQTKQKSFVGGVVFSVSSIWAVILVVWEYLKRHSA